MSQLLLMNTDICHLLVTNHDEDVSMKILLMNTDICHLLVTNHDEDVSITVDEYR